jgi:60 kDa SS-A/Ro ribonucleoprotein
LFGASVLRTNRDAEVIPFAETVRQAQFNPRDTVATNAQKCAGMWGGGTNCSAVLQWLNQRKATGDAVVYVSDYESWVDGRRHYYYGNQGTAMMNEWNAFKRRNQDAKLVCIDLTPYNTGQVEEKKDILQVGGFSDQVFNVVAAFIEGGNSENYWVDVIDSVEL